jgi:hypothetical protein
MRNGTSFSRRDGGHRGRDLRLSPTPLPALRPRAHPVFDSPYGTRVRGHLQAHQSRRPERQRPRPARSASPFEIFSFGASAQRSWRGRDLRARDHPPRGTGLLCAGSSRRLRREDLEPRMMATSTRSSVRTRIASLRAAEPSPRRRRAPSVRPSDRAFHDITMQPGEVAEFDTRIPHWYGPAGDRPVEILSILGREGERIHVRVAPRRKSASW